MITVVLFTQGLNNYLHLSVCLYTYPYELVERILCMKPPKPNSTTTCPVQQVKVHVTATQPSKNSRFRKKQSKGPRL